VATKRSPEWLEHRSNPDEPTAVPRQCDNGAVRDRRDSVTTDLSLPRVSVVVLAWKSEPFLRPAVRAALASRGVNADVVLVDNGCTDGDVRELSDLDGVTVVTPAMNLGFAGGCNAGVAAATGEFIGLVNADAIVAPTALAELIAALQLPDVAIAGGSVRLSSAPELINSAGNPVHVLGLSWAGRMGEPEHRTVPEEVAVASGACLVTTRTWWDALGGFDAEYFAYHEDAELSLRTWRAGRRVLYVPTAVAVHRYEFSRNASKMYLMERNRLVLIFTLWSPRALILLAPALLALEVALLVMSIAQGWWREKLRGWVWIWRHRSHVRERRRELAVERVVADGTWMARLTPVLEPNGTVGLPWGAAALSAIMSTYWSLVKRVI